MPGYWNEEESSLDVVHCAVPSLERCPLVLMRIILRARAETGTLDTLAGNVPPDTFKLEICDVHMPRECEHLRPGCGPIDSACRSCCIRNLGADLVDAGHYVSRNSARRLATTQACM